LYNWNAFSLSSLMLLLIAACGIVVAAALAQKAAQANSIQDSRISMLAGVLGLLSFVIVFMHTTKMIGVHVIVFDDENESIRIIHGQWMNVFYLLGCYKVYSFSYKDFRRCCLNISGVENQIEFNFGPAGRHCLPAMSCEDERKQLAFVEKVNELWKRKNSQFQFQEITSSPQDSPVSPRSDSPERKIIPESSRFSFLNEGFSKNEFADFGRFYVSPKQKPPSNPPFIYVSNCSREILEGLVSPLAFVLSRIGLTVSFDKLDEPIIQGSLDEYDETMLAELYACKVAISLISRHFNTSKRCVLETNTFLFRHFEKEDLTLIPVWYNTDSNLVSSSMLSRARGITATAGEGIQDGELILRDILPALLELSVVQDDFIRRRAPIPTKTDLEGILRRFYDSSLPKDPSLRPFALDEKALENELDLE
jgi:hypothetical protein